MNDVVQFMYIHHLKFPVNAGYVNKDGIHMSTLCINHHGQFFWQLVYCPFIMSWHTECQ